MLGVTTETRAQMNYAGSRMAPWLGHTMVSRSEVPRPLLTPGEVMQLPPDDALVMAGGSPPLRAKKVRYFEEPVFKARLRPAITPTIPSGPGRPTPWDGLVAPPQPAVQPPPRSPTGPTPRAHAARTPDSRQKSFEFTASGPTAEPTTAPAAPNVQLVTRPAPSDDLDAALGGPVDAVRVQFALDSDAFDSSL
jgi:type IV secretory pathway TraG/TraD family ATPase VirD4